MAATPSTSSKRRHVLSCSRLDVLTWCFPAWPATSLSGTHLARDPKKFADPCITWCSCDFIYLFIYFIIDCVYLYMHMYNFLCSDSLLYFFLLYMVFIHVIVHGLHAQRSCDSVFNPVCTVTYCTTPPPQ